MFRMKEHMYVDGPGHDEMGKFLKSFVPLVWIKEKMDLVIKCGDTEVKGGKVYKVLCSDKMAEVVNRRFNLVRVHENAGTVNGEPISFRTQK